MKYLLILWVAGCISQGFAQPQAKRIEHFNTSKNVAVQGYDVVSYFSGNPVEGKKELKAIHQGIIYLFASQSNLNKFKASPESFEPAYGGWCAYAMGENGEKVKIDPETYKIIDGKLYLFYNFWGNNTLTTWNKNEKKLKAEGDLNWRKFIQ